MKQRQLALKILGEVEEGSFLNLALKKQLKGMGEQDRRFVAALLYTTLENLGRIDYVIDSFTVGKRVHKLVRNVLRLGVCQLMYFETVPESAAVNESVKLIEKSPKRQLKGFVNAVLRNVAGNLGSIEYPSAEQEPGRYLSVLYSYPLWLAEKYIADYGFEFAEAMLAYHKEGAETCIRANRLKTTGEALLAKLRGRGFQARPGEYIEDCFYVRNIAGVDELDLFLKGLLAVQGEASMVVAEAAQVQSGQAVLDLCAAPGGKSAYVAQFGPGKLEAWDLHEHRVALMRENFARLGVAADCRVQDAAVFNPEKEGAFDCVLLDAPCSALGLLYRKPDIKYAKEPGEIEALTRTQREILAAAARYVKPGGRLVYSTCTISKEENDQNIDWFFENHKNFREINLAAALPLGLMSRARGGRMQLFPHLDGIDGFFLAVLQKEEV